MSEIVVTPEDLELLWKWHESAAALAAAKAKELTLRNMVFGRFFPNAKEGTTTIELPENWKVKGVAKLNRKVDEAALSASVKRLTEAGIVIEDVIRYKPELAVSKYREYPEHQRLLIESVLEITPGTPSVELVPPPAPKRKKA